MNSIVSTKPLHTRVMEAVLQGDKTHIQSLSSFFDEWDDRRTTIEYVSREEIENYQLHALNLTLEYVWNNNAFYREQLTQAGFNKPQIDTLQDFNRVPFLLKESLKGDKDKLLCCDRKKSDKYIRLRAQRDVRCTFHILWPITISMTVFRSTLPCLTIVKTMLSVLLYPTNFPNQA